MSPICRLQKPGDPCDNGHCTVGYVCDQTNKCHTSPTSPTSPTSAPATPTSFTDWVKAHMLLVGGIAAAVVLLLVLLMIV